MAAVDPLCRSRYAIIGTMGRAPPACTSTIPRYWR